MSYNSIRRGFLEYFKQHQHAIVPSSSLVPAEDPTLLFTNAGMNQFKDIFLGIEATQTPRIATAQRCVRAGGKHNDLENVGYTARHHTFFEMLGNFSFGDYFKKEAIELAFNYITKELKIPLERLWFTVHYSDDEAYDIWHKHINIPADRIVRCGDKDNFWAMGDVGPCGPCTEIFYDHGPSVAGGPPGSPDADGDRFMEIWNLVFMQFHRQPDGQQIPLPKPCVDTGMGLERLACVLEGVTSNFETSLFKSLKEDLKRSVPSEHLHEPSMNVLADHLRSSAFIIADGITPSAEGRGYVLRRLVRRALRHGYKMGIKEPFLHNHVAHLVTLMGEPYPILAEQQTRIQQVLLQEQVLFFETLQGGTKYFMQALERSPNLISGETLFKLYDTYGFPIDIALDEAKERGLPCDTVGFEKLMEERKHQSRQAQQHALPADVTQLPTDASVFLRDTLTASTTITAVIPVANDSNACWVCLDQTPFYAESGGQVGDNGWFLVGNDSFTVMDTQKIYHQIGHLVLCAPTALMVGQKLNVQVNEKSRVATARHHTATHLLHAALRSILGDSVQQKGSLVTPERLRFDFSFERALTPQEIAEIELYCQQHIEADRPVNTAVLTKEEALQEGALAFFEDKYGHMVRVLTIGDGFSKELCGGTHIESLHELMTLVIISEESVAAGVRRLQALAGQPALAYLKAQRECVSTLAASAQVHPNELVDTMSKLQDTVKAQQGEIAKLQLQHLQLVLGQLTSKTMAHGDLFIYELPSDQLNLLKTAADILRTRSPHVVGIVTCLVDHKLSLVLTCTQAIANKVQLKVAFDRLKDKFNLKGGGRPDLIQAGCTGADKNVLKALVQDLTNMLS